jgi:hypothetical protein
VLTHDVTQDYPAAIALLQPLLDAAPSEAANLPPSLYLALISLFLSSGSLMRARKVLERLLADSAAPTASKLIAKAIVASSYGNWQLVQDTLRDIEAVGGQDVVARNNMAVALLNAGKLQEVRQAKVVGWDFPLTSDGALVDCRHRISYTPRSLRRARTPLSSRFCSTW